MATIDLSQLVTAEMKAEQAKAGMLARFEAAIQQHVDAAAQERGYRDGFALAGYVASGVAQWAAEAQAFVVWRDAVWLHAHAELAKVTAGERAAPSVEDFIGELPAIEWPEQT